MRTLAFDLGSVACLVFVLSQSLLLIVKHNKTLTARLGHALAPSVNGWRWALPLDVILWFAPLLATKSSASLKKPTK